MTRQARPEALNHLGPGGLPCRDTMHQSLGSFAGLTPLGGRRPVQPSH